MLDSAAVQLRHEPGVETRNRKRLRPNPLSPWELRVGSLRVYFDIDEPSRLVTVRAVGLKRPGNRLFIGRDEVVIGEDPEAD